MKKNNPLKRIKNAIESKRNDKVSYFDSAINMTNQKMADNPSIFKKDYNHRRRFALTKKALQEKEKQYRNIYENAPFGIYHTTMDGKVLRVNPAFASMLKYDSPGDLITEVNKTNIAECTYLNPKQRKQIIKKITRYPGWHKFESLLKCKNGKTVIALLLKRKVSNPVSGKEEMEGFAEDITERKKMEKILEENKQKYQELVENINDVIFHLDNKGKIIYINKAVKRLSGYEPEEVMGHPFTDFVHPDDFIESQSKLGLALSGKSRPSEIRIVRKDKTIACVSSFGRLLIKDGKPKGIISVLTDLSEQKKAESRLVESYKYLGKINRQVSVLLDLNNVIKEKNGKGIINFIVLSALEISNSKFAALYKYQKEEKLFNLISMVSKDKISDREKSKIRCLKVRPEKCRKMITREEINKIENIEECFEGEKVKEFKKRHNIKKFYAMAIMNKKHLKGMLILGFLQKKNMNEQEKGFYDVFSKYTTFILLDIKALE